MKTIIKMLKPWIKTILIAQMKSNEDKILTAIFTKDQRENSAIGRTARADCYCSL